MNDRNINLSVFVDLQKAFDTVNHSILIRKLEQYGIRGLPLALISDYLCNRTQRVKIFNSFSSVRPVNLGIPQGSILGPILFLLYINDLPNISNVFFPVLFADDTTITFCDKFPNIFVNKCNADLEKLNSWTISNRLSINTEKTFYIVITNQIIDQPFPNVILNNEIIQMAQSGKFLGVILDHKMKFNLHINAICRKISKSIGILFKLRDYLPLPKLICLYYTFIYPYLIYCNLVWGSTFETHLKPLIILQKKVIRIINRADFNDHTNDLFYMNKILKIADIHNYNLAIYMYKNKNSSNFKRIHDYQTRHSSQLIPNYHRLTTTQHSLTFTGPITWNQIPERIRQARSLTLFKKAMKDHLLSK